jgi:hypothetical protein
MAAAGWVVFIALLLTPLFMFCWVGFFLRETWEVCLDCGWRIRKVEEPSFGGAGRGLPLGIGCVVLLFFILPWALTLLVVFMRFVLPVLLSPGRGAS